MSYETLKFQAEWFRAQEYQLEMASKELECIRQDILGVSYNWGVFEFGATLARFREPCLATVQELSNGEGGIGKGVELLDSLRKAVVDTGREYLLTEAGNEDLTREMELLIQQLDL